METTDLPDPSLDPTRTLPEPTIRFSGQPPVVGGAQVPVVPGYEVLALVGRGGMGRVYRARHLTLGRVVAIKLLSHEPDERSLARFNEEVRAVAQLQHPNIAQLFETGVADGQPFFTQEFLDGGSLAQKFDRKPQEPRAAARVVETLARALQHSHDQGILHRDLKPANILLAADGTPKVTDFGLAKTFATLDAPGETPPHGAGLTHTGEVLGTPAYMPPEQASGVLSLLGPPADVYGLGAILYEGLTGRPPFQGPDALRTVIMVREMDPVSPRVLQPDVPRDLETICLKCLAKEPHRRYASAGALADDLRRFLNREPITARPVGRWERTLKWARRKPWQAAAAALGAGLVAALVVGVSVAAEKNRQVRAANDQLEATNAQLEAANDGLERSNAALTEARNAALAEKARAEMTLGLALSALKRHYFEFADRLVDLPHSENVRRDVLASARSTLDGLCQFQGSDVKLLRFRMEGYDRLGNIESQVGLYADAEADYGHARDVAARILGLVPGDPDVTSDRVLATAKIASMKLRRGDANGADALLDALAPEMEALVAAHPDNPSVAQLEPLARQQLVAREARAGRWDGVEAQMRKVCAMARRHAATHSTNPAKHLAVIDADRELAALLTDLGKYDDAAPVLRDALRGVAALPDATSVKARVLRAATAATLGDYFFRRAAYPAAQVAYTAAVRDYGVLGRDFQDTPTHLYQQAESLRGLAAATSARGGVEDQWSARGHLEAAAKITKGLVHKHPGNGAYKYLHEQVTGLLAKLPERQPKN
ncbi:serine/threonine-protein kinase [Gemmata sp.]|uniref:serine/threonine-protein kinase n=1 Tax=Gemmata sp. TaxID=1914242 RepID=UPI003F71B8FD